MKTSVVLASALLSAFAAAAPVNRRDLVYTTQIVTETVVVYTTVYDDDYVPEATTTPEGLFYEQPQVTSSAVVEPTYSPAPAPAAKPEEPSSAPAQAPAPTPTPAPQAPAPTPVAKEPKTSAYVAPAAAPVLPSAAPAAASPAPQAVQQAPAASSNSGNSAAEHQDVDITVYDTQGGSGACGTALADTDFVAAIAVEAWNQAGGSTYDVMTGAATNPWCGQKINVSVGGGAPVAVTIMDMCPGCKGFDVDLTRAAWESASGTKESTRLKGSWSKA